MKATHVMTGYAGLMLAYTAWRTYDYMQGSLQGVGQLTASLVALAFLAFTEIGLLIWLHLASKNTTSNAQETVSTIMIWANFAGSMVIGLADILKHNRIYEIDLSVIDPILLLTPWLVVVVNIAGYLIFFQTDSENESSKAERQLQHEERMLEIEAKREAIRLLRGEKEIMRDALAPSYAKDIKDKVTGRTARRFAKDLKALDQPPASQPTNGKTDSGNFTTPQ